MRIDEFYVKRAERPSAPRRLPDREDFKEFCLRKSRHTSSSDRQGVSTWSLLVSVKGGVGRGGGGGGL